MTDLAIPNGWCVATIDQIVRSFGGSTPSKSDPSNWSGGSVPWVSPKDMKTFFVGSSEDAVTDKALDRLTPIPAESILMVVRSGILSRTLPIAINTVGVTINQDMRAFVPEDGIDARYLAWQLIGEERKILDKCSKDGTTVASIEAPAFSNYPLRIAPASEQKKIVEKLEHLLSELDVGTASLKVVQRNLVRYRQSLLDAAVKGALTGAWRAARADCCERKEAGAELLERILGERRTSWEKKQLEKFAERRQIPPKDWQSKYQDPSAPDLTGLPELPDGWVWVTAEQVCDFITKGTTPPKNFDESGKKDVPFLRVTNLTDDGSLNFVDRVFVSRETHEGFLSRSIVFPNDVLMNIVGPPLGQVSIVPDEFKEWNANQAIAIFRPICGVKAEYLCSLLLSKAVRRWLSKRAKTTAGQTNLTLEVCRALPLPLPPVSEQEAILQILDLHAFEAVKQVGDVEIGIEKAIVQRKNILKAAFAGKLVPQDPNDEPASVLLDRIRAARVAEGNAGTRKRGRKAKGSA